MSTKHAVNLTCATEVDNIYLRDAMDKPFVIFCESSAEKKIGNRSEVIRL
jgi:hypothetical protein